MTSRNRNFAILGVVLLLLVGAGIVIATKQTKLGLDLQGGIELVYEGEQEGALKVARCEPERRLLERRLKACEAAVQLSAVSTDGP